MVNQTFISTIQEKLPLVKDWFFDLINLSSGSGKLLNILIVLVIGYLALKITTPIIKVLIIILIIVLIIQSGLSFI